MTTVTLTLDNASVDENSAGAVIGNLAVSDPDAGDNRNHHLLPSAGHRSHGEDERNGGPGADIHDGAL